MFTFYREKDYQLIAELSDKSLKIRNVHDAIDLMSDLAANECNRIIIHESNLNEDFFYLKTGLAGEILQKFSTYRIRLAIVGNFAKYHSKSLQDFIRESNRGNSIFFVVNLDSAISRLKSD